MFGYTNIVWYGADPTGVADSTTAINSSFTASLNVFAPSGNFKITSQINITNAHQTFKGAGRLTTNIRSTATSGIIFNVSAGYVEISSMAIGGPIGSASTSGAAINATSGCTGCNFNNLYISEAYGAIFTAATANKIDFVKVLDIYGPNVVAISGGGNNVINSQLDPVFYGCTYTYSSGFAAWQSSHSYAACSVVSNGGNYYATTSGGTSAGSGGPTGGVFNVGITDNTVTWFFLTPVLSAGISASGNSNIIRGNDVSGPWGAGIIITASDGDLIEGNTIGQNLGNGVQLGNTATNTLVQGNTFAGSYGTLASAIQDDSSGGSATGLRAFNNYINSASWMAIYVASNTANVQGNRIRNWGQITGASYGIGFAANIVQFTGSGNNVAGTNSIQVATGTSDFYNIIGNITNGNAVSDGGSGTHKTLTGNN